VLTTYESLKSDQYVPKDVPTFLEFPYLVLLTEKWIIGFF